MLRRASLLVVKLAALSTASLGVVGCSSSPSRPDEAREWSLPIREWPGGLLSVSGASSDDVWIVGAATNGAPSVLRWRGDRWETVEPPTRGTLWWVHVVDVNTVFVGGEHGLVARWRGDRFETMDTPGSEEETVFGVWARDASDLYAVGGVGGRRGFVWHWNGVAWREVELPSGADEGAIFKVWGDAERVYLVGASGRGFVRRGEAPFSPIETGGTETLLTVAGDTRTGEVLAVGGGSNASVVRLAPSVRRDELGLPFLQGVAFDGDGQPWATGGRGTIVRRSDERWVDVDPGFPIPGQSLHAVWVDPEGGVWAVGGDVIASPLRAGVLLHGATERSASPPTLPPPSEPPRPALCETDGDLVRCEGLGADLSARLGARFDPRERVELPVVPVEPVDPDPFPAPVGAEAFGDPALGVGTGRERFVALRHGDPLRWEAGVQGGHHVWVSARLDDAVLRSLGEDVRREVTTQFVLTRRDGSPLGELTRLGGYVVGEEGWELLGNFSVLPTGIRPSRLDEEPLHLVVRVMVPTEDEVLEREVWARSECCD